MYLGRFCAMCARTGSSGLGVPAAGQPQPMIEWFWNMQIDDELQERYGFRTTETDKRNSGENQAHCWN